MKHAIHKGITEKDQKPTHKNTYKHTKYIKVFIYSNSATINR